MSPDIEVRIAALRDGLVAAVQQIPSTRMPESTKAALAHAAEIAAKKLASEPDRLPR
ncbi:hypothetical protein ACRAWD_02665 [Caulobacter segnis]